MVSVRPWQALLSVVTLPVVLVQMMERRMRTMMQLQKQSPFAEVVSAPLLWAHVHAQMQRSLMLRLLVGRLRCPASVAFGSRFGAMVCFHPNLPRCASFSAYANE